MTTISIPDNWQPTAANVNALPGPLRSYIHDLESNCDPSYTMQELRGLQQKVKDLEAALQIAKRNWSQQ